MSFEANENGPLMSFVAVAVAVAATAAQNDLFVAIFLLSDLFLLVATQCGIHRGVVGQEQVAGRFIY